MQLLRPCGNISITFYLLIENVFIFNAANSKQSQNLFWFSPFSYLQFFSVNKKHGFWKIVTHLFKSLVVILTPIASPAHFSCLNLPGNFSLLKYSLYFLRSQNLIFEFSSLHPPHPAHLWSLPTCIKPTSFCMCNDTLFCVIVNTTSPHSCGSILILISNYFDKIAYKKIWGEQNCT